MPVDETELIVRAKTGDRMALNELVARYWQPVYHFASYKLGNSQDAEEVAQETFIRVFRALPEYQITGAVFTAYIKRIAVNLITDFWRKKSRSPAIADIAEVQELAADGQEPDLQLLSSEMREILLSVLQKLPPEQRQAVELRIIAGLPVRETALTMGKSEAAIKMLQQRALKNLRMLLADTEIIERCAGR
jgi:RNA polymerase sigma-70 factor (ECF subfamily)